MKKLMMATLGMAAIGLMSGTPAQAFVQTWELLDHPDGAQNPPPYGLRLDRVNTVNDKFSFSFGSLGDMRLKYFSAAEVGGERIEIKGTATGGRFVEGNGNAVFDQNGVRVWSDKATWNFDLTYDTNITRTGNGVNTPIEVTVDDVINSLNTTPTLNGRVEVVDNTMMQFDDVNYVYNAGSSLIQNGDFFELKSRGKGSDGISGNHFFFDKSLHRLPNGGGPGKSGSTVQECLAAGYDAEMCNRWTGAGWVTITSSTLTGLSNQHDTSTACCRDLLFTARLTDSQTVPTPATLGLFGVGLLGLVALRRRRADAPTISGLGVALAALVPWGRGEMARAA